MMLYTIQMAQWRLAQKLEIPMIDTTIKSGEKTFQPSWEIVTAVKSGVISPEVYTEEYLQIMRDSYKNNRSRWLEVCNMPVVAIACYCPDGQFCHRHVLATCFKYVCRKNGLPFELKGELLASAKH